MATILPVLLDETGRKRVYSWGPIAGGDACAAINPDSVYPLAGSIQFEGTFGGTITLQGSNNGLNWIDLKDTVGNAISTNARAAFEFSTAMAFLRPNPGAGIGAVVASICMRG